MKKFIKKSVSASKLRRITASVEEFSELSFDEQIDWLQANSDLIWSYDSLIDYAITELKRYNVGFALFIIRSIYESDGEYYMWDSTAGSTDTIKPITNENVAIDVYNTIFE